ncbi:BTB/POZ domain-containing protein kctd15-like [Glandiceps talaboti]
MAYQIKTTVGEMVSLNVGGKLYTTSLTTLTRFPDSMLGAMFSGNVPVQTDDKGNYLIDRDGELFRHVLNFLRTSRLTLPGNFDEHDLLMEEADFYQLVVLKEALVSYQDSCKVHDKGTPVDHVVYAEQGRYYNDPDTSCTLTASRQVIESLPSLMRHFRYGECNCLGINFDKCESFGISFYKSIDCRRNRLSQHLSTLSHLELFRDLEALHFSVVSSACGYNKETALNTWTFRRGSRLK